MIKFKVTPTQIQLSMHKSCQPKPVTYAQRTNSKICFETSRLLRTPNAKRFGLGLNVTERPETESTKGTVRGLTQPLLTEAPQRVEVCLKVTNTAEVLCPLLELSQSKMMT